MEIERNYYLNKLISKKENKLIKIITGIKVVISIIFNQHTV